MFYSHEPDFDLANPAVREAIRRIMAFWLRLGASGSRTDALPYVVHSAEAAEAFEDGTELLGELREFVALHHPEPCSSARSTPIEEYDDYFLGGEGASLPRSAAGRPSTSMSPEHRGRVNPNATPGWANARSSFAGSWWERPWTTRGGLWSEQPGSIRAPCTRRRCSPQRSRRGQRTMSPPGPLASSP
jgi:glycosidase